MLFLDYRKEGYGMNGFDEPTHLLFLKEDLKVYTYTDLEISLYGRVQINIILWKFRILNTNNSQVIYP